jgi:hypothetical protein
MDMIVIAGGIISAVCVLALPVAGLLLAGSKKEANYGAGVCLIAAGIATGIAVLYLGAQASN